MTLDQSATRSRPPLGGVDAVQLSASQTRTATSSPRSDQGDQKKVLDTTVTDEAASLGGEVGKKGKEGRERKQD